MNFLYLSGNCWAYDSYINLDQVCEIVHHKVIFRDDGTEDDERNLLIFVFNGGSAKDIEVEVSPQRAEEIIKNIMGGD